MSDQGQSDSFDANLDVFRQEADELLGKIEAIILVIEERPADRDALNQLFRAVHTLKGSSAMFGLTDVAEFSHSLESVLDKVRSGQLLADRTLIDLTLAYRDEVGKMLNAAQGEHADCNAVADITWRLRVLDKTTEASGPAAPAKPEAIPAPVQGPLIYRIRFTPQPGLFATGTNPLLLLEELRGLGECTVVCDCDNVPALGQADPEGCYLSWDIILTTPAGRNAIRDVFVFVEDISTITIDEILSEHVLNDDRSRPRLGEILVDRGDVKASDLQDQLQKQTKIGDLLVSSGAVSSAKVASALNEQKTITKHQQAAISESVRVPSDKLDALINLLGELVINQARISQIAHGMNDLALAAPVEEGDRLTNELRDIVLNIRMMPIGTTFSRFKRLVRDLSAELGKQIDLETEGAETELDKTVIDRLGEPLVHLIRNSIDHGIEHPDERVSHGKPERGTIKLTAAHVGANVVISIIDDGKGLDKARILAKAKEKGLITADADLSEKEIYDLIFQPGFSTAKAVTDVSGRGVGLDVVRREIDALRGSIAIQSTPGQGSRIDLSLPLTLAIIDGLLVNVADERYVVPLSAIEGCMELVDDCYATSKERNLVNVRGTSVPLIRLRDLFDLHGARAPLEQVVVVNVGDVRVGLVVDQVIGNHQTVIKSLGKVYQKADCISGATILGDGLVAVILDLAAIVRNARKDEDAIIAARGASRSETAA